MKRGDLETILQKKLVQDYDLVAPQNDAYNLPIYSDKVFDFLKPAGVLVPIVERDGDLNLILTRRSAKLAEHSGQVAFPGGRKDAEDFDLKQTALREAHEEIGLEEKYVDVIGAGDNYQTNSGYVVKPILGFVEPRANFRKNEGEVADIFEIPFSYAFDVKNQKQEFFKNAGETRYYYAINYDGHFVWGVTAAIIRMLSIRIFGDK